jgi:hypothetical protein
LLLDSGTKKNNFHDGGASKIAGVEYGVASFIRRR